MSEPILSREAIARDAELAAERFAQHGVDQPNPHAPYTDAALAWQASYERSKQALVHESESAA